MHYQPLSYFALVSFLTIKTTLVKSLPYIVLIAENFYERSTSPKNTVLTCLAESGIETTITSDHFDINEENENPASLTYTEGSPDFYKAPTGKLLVLKSGLENERYGVYRCLGQYAPVDLGSGSDTDYQLLPDLEFQTSTSIFVANQDSPVQRADFVDLTATLSSHQNVTVTKTVTLPFLTSQTNYANWRLISSNEFISSSELNLTYENPAGWYLANLQTSNSSNSSGGPQLHQGIPFQLIKKTCQINKWGPNCTRDCVPCFNGGICSEGECICPAGFGGSQCEQLCGFNRFGKNCQWVCMEDEFAIRPEDLKQACRGKQFCLPEPLGCSCATGYTGEKCMLSCENLPGSFGNNCGRSCHCENYSVFTNFDPEKIKKKI